ncbi:hypothetical protein FisN_16Lh227 [Fistulifera solaris]|uniref:protein-histidine N-methyltransferase n=1 Tax=Fistulifera solaris TaxID=1519565 RepID=A0A1Z5J6A6_FISSO|nr:hypothetical protein FisN_16Lh227 [Fistulifera solaris]|eukprot:GAX09534.1 hypothetical protein FisN_16Lh227 [Fistulifera solaris]
MSSFSFDFFAPQEKKNTTLTTPSQRQVGPPHQWVTDLEQVLKDRVQQAMVYVELELPQQSLPLRCIDTKANTLSSTNLVWETTDLLPNVYEGGMKVWECSMDLLHFLAKEQPKYSSVLEIGCGHALPACYLLRVALQQKQEPFHLYLTDFNDFVIQQATIPNSILNAASIMEQPNDPATIVSAVLNHVQFGHGDWLSLQLPSQVDLVLASETLYSEQAAEETALLLSRHLSDTGSALVATKRFYFGVGGGTDAFLAWSEKYKLLVEVVQSFDTGAGNIREILRVRKKAE